MAIEYGFWEDNLHGTTDRMLACLVLWGPKNDFPAASAATKGRMGIATDEHKIYYDNGTDWVEEPTALIPLARIPTPLTGKSADTVDGKHAADLVQMAGAQTIDGVKTFSSIPVFPVSTLPNTGLKTAMGSASGTVTAGGNIDATLSGYPLFLAVDAHSDLRPFSRGTSPSAPTIGHLYIHNPSGSNQGYYFAYRYLTSSGKPEIWLGLDKDSKIIAVWEAEDPPLTSPPIESEQIVKLIKLNPSPKGFRAMREATENRLSSMILEEGTITDNKLTFRDFSLDVEVRNKDDMPRTRKTRKIVTKMVKQQVSVIIPKRTFNEVSGQWEDGKEQKIDLVPTTRYRLAKPELGEQSPIEAYKVIVPHPVFEEKEVSVEKEIEVEETIS